MKKKSKGAKQAVGKRASQASIAADADRSEAPDYGLAIAGCQRILRYMTMAIMASFVLIIVLTTVSTSSFVQVAAKGLYHVILLSALTSLAAWVVRVRLEKKTGRVVNVPAEILKRL